MKGLGKWQHRWFGMWRENGDAYIECPSIHDFVCPTASADYNKEKIAYYLDNAKVIATTSRLNFPCVISGKLFIGQISYRTDGHWLWLDDLSHYVREHDLCIPSAMMEAIRERNYEPPEVANELIEKLEWPLVKT